MDSVGAGKQAQQMGRFAHWELAATHSPFSSWFQRAGKGSKLKGTPISASYPPGLTKRRAHRAAAQVAHAILLWACLVPGAGTSATRSCARPTTQAQVLVPDALWRWLRG